MADGQNDPQFPSTDDFMSYDEMDPEEGQSQLPVDSFDESKVTDEEGCGCFR